MNIIKSAKYGENNNDIFYKTTCKMINNSILKKTDTINE